MKAEQIKNPNRIIEEDIKRDERQLLYLRTNPENPNITFCKRIDLRQNFFGKNIFKHLTNNEPFACYLFMKLESLF